MNRESNVSTKPHLTYIILILLAAMLFLISVYKPLSISNLPDSHLYATELISFSEGWHSVDSPSELKDIAELSTWKIRTPAPVTISNTLPELTNYDCLFIENNFNYMKVYADNSCIYDYSEDAVQIPNKMTGHFIAQIPLDASLSGKTISIEFYQPHEFSYTGINSVMIGPGSAYITDYLSSHLELIISSFIIHFVGICLLAVCLWQKYRKMGENAALFRSLGLFLIISGMWIFTDSQLPQLLWHNSIAVCVVSFFCFMAFPIPLFTFVGILCPDSHKTYLTAIRYLLLANILAQGILYVSGIFSFVQMLPATHTLIALSVIVLLINLSQQYRRNKSPYAQLMLLALIILIISGVFALVYFYFSPQTDNSRYFRYGFLAFIAILVYICIKAMLSFIQEYTEHKILKELAYSDFLTGTESRLAFEEYMAELKNSHVPHPLTLYVFDLNNLKTTNDTYGHNAGDIILKNAASCIMQIFSGPGRVFRIGGDEFVAIVQISFDELPDLGKHLEQTIQKRNETSEYPFTLSFGHASSQAVQGNAIDLLLKKADQEMYKKKETFHKHEIE